MLPFSNPSPGLLNEARAVVTTSHMTMPFYQTGYIGLLALGLWFGGLKGIFFLQAVAYVVSVFLTYALVTAAGGSRIAAVTAALILAVQPYMFLNIKRIADNDLAIPSLLGLTLVVVWIWRGAEGTRTTVTAGLIAGIAVVTRSNFAPVLVLALWPLMVRRRCADIALIVAIALSLVLATNRSLTGHWQLTPTEGAYTFYIGANQFTAHSLLCEYNSEGSLTPALRADHIDLNGTDAYSFANDHQGIFWKLGFQYVVDHPIRYIGLGLLKILTTFRPDYRQVPTSKAAPTGVLVLVQTCLALIAILWIATRIYLARRIGVLHGVLAIPIVMLLLVPIFLFNGDPRFRRPIEAIAIADTICCWDVRLKRHRETDCQAAGLADLT